MKGCSGRKECDCANCAPKVQGDRPRKNLGFAGISDKVLGKGAGDSVRSNFPKAGASPVNKDMGAQKTALRKRMTLRAKVKSGEGKVHGPGGMSKPYSPVLD